MKNTQNIHLKNKDLNQILHVVGKIAKKTKNIKEIYKEGDVKYLGYLNDDIGEKCSDMGQLFSILQLLIKNENYTQKLDSFIQKEAYKKKNNIQDLSVIYILSSYKYVPFCSQADTGFYYLGFKVFELPKKIMSYFKSSKFLMEKNSIDSTIVFSSIDKYLENLKGTGFYKILSESKCD